MKQANLPKANAECKICGKKYYVCVPCIKNKDKGIYGWRLVACCPQCFQIFYAFNCFKKGDMTREEVVEIVEGVKQYIELPKLLPPYDGIYEEIFGKPQFEQKTAEKQEAPVVEPAPTVEPAVEAKVEVKAETPVKENKPHANYDYHKPFKKHKYGGH